MPRTTSPITVYWPVQKEAVVEHDEELAVGGIVAVALARHADDAALERHLGELGLEVRMLRAAGAIAVLAVAGLRHEAVDDAVERHVVVKTFARQHFQTLGMAGRDVGAQFYDDHAGRGLEDQRILRIGSGEAVIWRSLMLILLFRRAIATAISRSSPF